MKNYFCPNCYLVDLIDIDSLCCDNCGADVCTREEVLSVAKEVLCTDAKDKELINLQIRVKKLEDELWQLHLTSRRSSETGW